MCWTIVLVHVAGVRAGPILLEDYHLIEKLAQVSTCLPCACELNFICFGC